MTTAEALISGALLGAVLVLLGGAAFGYALRWMLGLLADGDDGGDEDAPPPPTPASPEGLWVYAVTEPAPPVIHPN